MNITANYFANILPIHYLDTAFYEIPTIALTKS